MCTLLLLPITAIDMVSTQAVTMTSTITRFTSTVRTPPLTTTPAITSSPLITRLASSVSPTILNSLLPSLTSTGVIKGTSSLSSRLPPSPVPSSSLHDMLSSSPVIGTTSSMTTEEPTTNIVLTTVPRDDKPNLLNPVDFIRYRSGTVFEYPIPPDTFFDKEDGSTPHLSLSLLGEDYQLVDSSSWIQLDEDRQALLGVIISDSLVTSVHQFFLAATDSKGGVAYDSFKIEIYPNEIDYSHQYRIILNSNFLQFMADSRNLYNFCRTLVTYHKDSLSSLNVQAVSNGSVTITYSNNTIWASFCDLLSIEAVLRQMVFTNGSLVPEFQSEMGKLFPVSDVLVEYLGKCAGVVTTDSPVIPKSPQIGDSTIFISLLIGLCLIFILFLIGCLLCMYCTKKRPGEEYLLTEEKIVYTKNRKPVILKNDRDDQKPPHRTYPAILPDDISPFKPQRRVTPPVKSIPPPSYKPFPAQDNFLELDDFGHFPPGNPPPGYSPSPIPGPPSRQDPPAYQEPPPYFPSQKNSENGKFQTTHF
ncbi:Dystroglycan [Holothuria leucospilota]|uniref:Dystroglycan n=1 Tax=Holothuria leucospilota TaxID=206669 RepID=A0A9Q1CKQ5_HOLLE|nr:Dystroglycan [Holothuria leucospilota]